MIKELYGNSASGAGIWLEQDIPRPFATRREDTLTICSVLCIWISCDFIEWFYHYLGHRFVFMWQFHRAHPCFSIPVLRGDRGPVRGHVLQIISDARDSSSVSDQHGSSLWNLCDFLLRIRHLHIGDTKRLGWTRTIQS